MNDAERIQWYEDQHALHYGLELLYVVDGYQLTCVMDSDLVAWQVEAPTLSACIDLAVKPAAEFVARYRAMRESQANRSGVK